VKATIEGKSYYRWHHGAGFYSQSLTPVHFGVGSAEVIDEVMVTWPSGIVEIIYDVQVNQTLRLKEGENPTGTGVNDGIADRPFKAYNYPNPFYKSTIIHFELTNPGTLGLSIFALSGKELFQATQANHQAGSLAISWDGPTKKE
jgi:hypothetical protein